MKPKNVREVFNNLLYGIDEANQRIVEDETFDEYAEKKIDQSTQAIYDLLLEKIPSKIKLPNPITCSQCGRDYNGKGRGYNQYHNEVLEVLKGVFEVKE